MVKRSLRTEKKRRIEKRTDYKLRFGLLKSGKARIVIRRSNKYFTIQVVESSESKDKILFGITSKDLIKSGWDAKLSGSLKSLPAGYLTGLLFANKLKEKKFNKELIVDLGMRRTIDGNRSYSVIKGLVDGGLKLNVNEKIFPPEGRLNGEHLKPEVKEMISQVRSKLGGVSPKEGKK